MPSKKQKALPPAATATEATKVAKRHGGGVPTKDLTGDALVKATLRHSKLKRYYRRAGLPRCERALDDVARAKYVELLDDVLGPTILYAMHRRHTVLQASDMDAATRFKGFRVYASGSAK